MGQKIVPINKSEEEWIRTGIEASGAFVQQFSGESVNGFPAPGQLDTAFANWLAAHDPDTEDPNPIINLVGLGFGQLLADRCNLEWVVVRESGGAEIALLGQ